MAKLNGEAHHIKVFNLPQHAAIKIHGFSSPAYNLPDDAVLLFDRLEGTQAFCKVEGTDNEISIAGDTTVVELGGDEYKVEGGQDEETDRTY
jgi:hypothetical protein